MRAIIFTLLVLFQATAKADMVISNLVEPVKYFVNHESQLNELQDKLMFHQKASLIGISGIGKTQLARMYAYKNKSKYKLIWFFDCNSDLNQSFAILAKEINRYFCVNNSCKLSEDLNFAQEEVMKYLSDKKDWLLVFDNLKINQNDMLKSVLSWEHNGHVILCSQDSKNLLEVVRLSQLKKEDSIKLINNILKQPSDKMVLELAEAFNGYPILTAQGAIFLSNNKYMTLEEYKEVIGQSKNVINTHVELVLNQLTAPEKDLLYKIAIINNQEFSKELLSKIALSQEGFSKNLHNLTRFGLITSINDNEKIFEMHDVIKHTLLQLANKKVVIQNINSVLDKLNELMPRGVTSKYLELSKDRTLVPSLEQLLLHAEEYKADISKIMELRMNLMSYYSSSLDYYNCKKMEEWLLNQRLSKSIQTLLTNTKNKAIYSAYLCDIGVYEHFANSSIKDAIKYLEEARDNINKIEGYPELKFTIYAQLAQAYVFSGGLKEAEANLRTVEDIIKAYPRGDFDLGLYWFLRAKSFLNYGKYEEALKAIEENIKAEAHLPLDVFTAPTYILQSEILNYLERYAEAYDVSLRIHNLLKNHVEDDHEVQARVLVQLSRSQLGLGKAVESLDTARKAKGIYMKLDSLTEEDFNNSYNVALASSLVSEGDSLAGNGKFSEALKSYAMAESIFYNIYRENMGYIDGISYLYLRGAKAAYKLEDKFWYHKFGDQLINKFGSEHPRTKELAKFKL